MSVSMFCFQRYRGSRRGQEKEADGRHCDTRLQQTDSEKFQMQQKAERQQHYARRLGGCMRLPQVTSLPIVSPFFSLISLTIVCPSSFNLISSLSSLTPEEQMMDKLARKDKEMSDCKVLATVLFRLPCIYSYQYQAIIKIASNDPLLKIINIECI